jgi:hypothetical protein
LRTIAVVAIAATSVLSALSWGVGPGANYYRSGYWPIGRSENYLDLLAGRLRSNPDWPVTNAKIRAVALVPGSASVSASFNINPHLAHRTHVYEWPNPWIGTNWGICNIDNLPDPATVDWIVVNRDYLTPDPAQVALLDRLLRNEFVVRFEEDHVLAAERVHPPATPGVAAPTSCNGR